MNGETSSLDVRVANTLREKALVSAGETVLVAVSGGADSTALLLLLCSSAQTLGIHICAAHYEHGIRGEASLEDARFVQALCEKRNVPCHVGHGDVPRLAKEWKMSMEAAARRARYAFLDETATRIGAAKIALAHHQDDQAETLLLHLVHGAGVQGLSGMRIRQGNRIRPLLDIPRMEIEAYLRAQGQPWREDATNAQTLHARNLLRHEVFPLLRKLNPQVAAAMARTATIMADTAAYLARDAQAQIEGRVKRMPYGAFWEVQAGTTAPDTVRLFASWAGVPPLDADQTQRLALLKTDEQAALPGGWVALRTKKRLHLMQNQTAPFPVQYGDQFVKSTPKPGAVGDGIRSQVFDAGQVAGAVFRTRRPGDVFAPLGSAGTQKLKKTLQDAGMDRPFRDLLPLLAKGDRILWIVGLRPARDAAITPQTVETVQFDYHGDLPWEITAHHNGGRNDD